MRLSLNLFCFITLPLLLSWSSAKASNDWILGTWWYADSSGRIIEGEDKDGMRFARDGSVTLVYGSGKAYLTCQYSIPTNAELIVDCIVRGEKRRLAFVIDPDRKQLANVEDRDKGFYMRPIGNR